MDPEDSLNMGDEHLSTISKKESNEVIKASVEDLVPIPSESEDTSDNDSECDLPFCDDSFPLDVLCCSRRNFYAKDTGRMLRIDREHQTRRDEMSRAISSTTTTESPEVLDECLALADLGASINLMPLFVWKKLSLPELTPTRMTLELASRSVAYSEGVAEDVFIKVGTFYFLADFVVVDYDVDPRVPLIIGRHGLSSAQILMMYMVKLLTIRFNTLLVRSMLKKCSDFRIVQRVAIPLLRILSLLLLNPRSLLLRRRFQFLAKIETFLRTPYELSNLDDDYYDTEGDILYLEKLLNEDPSLNFPPIKNDNLKQVDVTRTKPSIEEPPELELKNLPSHFRTYAFL
ncbi:reverse transcriptase domain-containing protein [Tanacetum coccineum]